MLEIQHVTKRFGGVTALNSCSFSMEQGSITALVGPNGAGKTTLFDVISGIIKADEGTVFLTDSANTTALTRLPAFRIARLGISRTWQQVRLFKYLSIQDHLFMAEHPADDNVIKSFFTVGRVPVERYRQTLERFGIERGPEVLASELSYGQRKLLQLAMAVSRPHALLLLDEPVAGVNQRIQERIESLLLDFKKAGETILVIEHDMEFVKKLADKAVVMDEGRVLAEGLPRAVLQDKRVIEAYLGE